MRRRTNQQQDDAMYDACFAKGTMRHILYHPFVGSRVMRRHTNQQEDDAKFDACFVKGACVIICIILLLARVSFGDTRTNKRMIQTMTHAS